MRNWIVLLCGLGWVNQALSFPCYVTVVKDSCWTDYNVQIEVRDEAKNKMLTTISIPKGKSFNREAFECSVKQELAFSATFSPVFWENDQGKHYDGLKFIFLPKTIKPGEAAWNIPICFASAFSKVPLPPTATGNCTCDFSKIPPVKQ